MIFQNPTSHLDPVMRVGKPIGAGLMLHQGLSATAARTRAIELLGEVGFSDPSRQVDAFPHELSGGMRQRAMIAAALSCEPAILIADEPTTALDAFTQRRIIDLIVTRSRERRPPRGGLPWLTKDPAARPTASTALTHPWMVPALEADPILSASDGAEEGASAS